MKRINLAQISTIGADWSWTFECARRAVAWSTDPALLERPAVEVVPGCQLPWFASERREKRGLK